MRGPRGGGVRAPRIVGFVVGFAHHEEAEIFPSSVIRKLANSEEMLAETENFVGLAAHVKGPVDIEAMSGAYDALLESRPVLTARLERGSDGRHQIVVDDLLPAGMEVVELDDPAAEDPPLRFDQSEALVHFRVTIRDGQAQPTLYVHHSLSLSTDISASLPLRPLISSLFTAISASLLPSLCSAPAQASMKYTSTPPSPQLPALSLSQTHI